MSFFLRAAWDVLKYTDSQKFRALCRPFTFKRYQSDKRKETIKGDRIPTNFFNDVLPKLPLPTIEDTKVKLLKSARVIMSRDEYSKFENNFNKFLLNEANDMQNDLFSKSKASNFMADFWTQSYLLTRCSTARQVNVLLGMKDDSESQGNMFIRAARIINFAAEYILLVRNQTLLPQISGHNFGKEKLFDESFGNLSPKEAICQLHSHKKYPYDMTSFAKFFGSCRIPMPMVDSFVSTDIGATNHVIIISKGQFFKMNIFNETGNPYSASAIRKALEKIQEYPEAEIPIGIFTSLPREDWAAVRCRLINEDKNNILAFHDIETSLFVLCLDNYAVNSGGKLSKMTYFMKENGQNRFYDKSIQFLVDCEGSACINFEHTVGDALPVLRIIDEISARMNRISYINDDSQPPKFSFFQFNGLQKFETDCKHAILEFKKFSSLIDVNLYVNDKITRKSLANFNLHGDAMMQLMFQCSYFSAYGCMPSIYESVSMLAFEDGRTETMRPLTEETYEFVRLFYEDPENSDLISHLKRISDLHKSTVVKILKGDGFDRHLFALEQLGRKKGITLSAHSDFFDSSEYLEKICKFQISSSSLSSENLSYFCYAPPWKDCIGLPYRIGNKSSGCTITSYKNSEGGLDGVVFAKELDSTYKRITNLLKL